MITCPICNTKNLHLDVICKNCGSFLQQKIENINLFEVLWLLLENPKKGLRIVAIAKHKNYIIFLSAFIGISYTFKIFEVIRVYDFISKPLSIFLGGFILGTGLGFIILATLTYLSIILSKVFKLVKLKFKQIYSAYAFAGTPIIYILIFIFPLKIMNFGVHLFSNNPSAFIINPTVYWITEVLTYLCILYFLILLVISNLILFNLKIIKALILTFILIIFIIISYVILPNILVYNFTNG